MSHDEKVKNSNIGIKAGRKGHYGQSFWVPIKHVIRNGDAVEGDGSYSSVHRLNNIIIMRYAEVLLNYAECCLRTGDAATAKTYINMIQQRAGSKTISADVDLVTLKKEKSFELWFESCRYQDLMRWSKIDNDAYTNECMDHLKKQGTHIPNLYDKVLTPVANLKEIYPGKSDADLDIKWQHSANGTDPEDRFYIVHSHEAQDAGFTVGWQEKNRLFPYPTSIIQNNPALQQNPGY